MKEFFDFLKSLGCEVVECRIPSQKPTDIDIDKVYVKEMDSKESMAYRRVRMIANTDTNNVKWDVAIKNLSQDVNIIYEAIKDNNLKFPEELKEFVENCCAIMDFWDTQYRQAFNAIKEYRDSIKTPKSIDDMNAEELREYIRKHNIK